MCHKCAGSVVTFFKVLTSASSFTCRYVKTREGLSQAGQVTTSALSSVGMVITSRLAAMRYFSSGNKKREKCSIIFVNKMMRNES